MTWHCSICGAYLTDDAHINRHYAELHAKAKLMRVERPMTQSANLDAIHLFDKAKTLPDYEHEKAMGRIKS